MSKLLQAGQRRLTAYEWDFEEVDRYGDILDHNHSDTLVKCYFSTDFDPEVYELVLIRDSGCENDGMDDRQWAYAAYNDCSGQWELPKNFNGGNVVPQKYHRELKHWQSCK